MPISSSIFFDEDNGQEIHDIHSRDSSTNIDLHETVISAQPNPNFKVKSKKSKVWQKQRVTKVKSNKDQE